MFEHSQDQPPTISALTIRPYRESDERGGCAAASSHSWRPPTSIRCFATSLGMTTPRSNSSPKGTV